MAVAKDNRAERLLACWRAGVAAADPRQAVAGVLDELAGATRRPWILALGKAAGPMVQGTLEWLRRHGGEPAGGLAVAPEELPQGPVASLAGDHPVPGPRSRRAAEAVGRFCAALPAGAPVWVLLSGGTSSLIGAPAAGLTEADLRDSYLALLESGLDIRRMNLVRKRLSRWGGGQLLAALGERPILQLVVSDVIGDDLTAIGSGPLVPDPSPVTDAWRALEASGTLTRLPGRARLRLQALADDVSPRGAADAAPVSRIVVSNRIAVRAAAEAGRRNGWAVRTYPDPLEGEAAEWGPRLVAELMAPRDPGPLLLVAGGETTVSLPAAHLAPGGRCHELALAAARALQGLAGVRLLAAGTDGRDGPTPAAGALVDGGTWERIRQAGGDPEALLLGHQSHDALAAAGDLVVTGPTGTNVADLVLALRDEDRGRATTAGPASR